MDRSAQIDFVLAAIVGEHGRLLMQERDSVAPVDPDCWSLPGGGVEPGEVPDAAVLRELDEETGLTADQVLGLHRLGGPRPTYCVGHGREEIFLVYLAFTELADDDVICGEGRQMVFVAPADLASRKLNDHTRACLPELVAAIAAQRS